MYHLVVLYHFLVVFWNWISKYARIENVVDLTHVGTFLLGEFKVHSLSANRFSPFDQTYACQLL